MTEAIVWHIAATVLATFSMVNFFLLIWIIIHSRRWTAPIHAALISQLQNQVDIMKGYQSRTQEELLTFKHEYIEANDHIWREIKANGTSMNRGFEEVDNRLDRLSSIIDRLSEKS